MSLPYGAQEVSHGLQAELWCGTEKLFCQPGTYSVKINWLGRAPAKSFAYIDRVISQQTSVETFDKLRELPR